MSKVKKNQCQYGSVYSYTYVKNIKKLKDILTFFLIWRKNPKFLKCSA